MSLTQEAERTDDRRLLRLAVADGEKADNADDQQHKCQYCAQDRHDNGEAQQQRHNAEQNIHNAELKPDERGTPHTANYGCRAARE